ncbi:MAG: hypothetical protein KW793_04760 [Candidatus Doudnabacteria bacterium]|nr:hypothetical protein [Candidatus Doudnabacteria bacterium]
MKTKDPNQMEMPCKCDCGECFDLDDGYPSLHSNQVICESCHEIEIEQQDEERCENNEEE